MTLEIRNILVGTFVVILGALFLVFSSRGGVEPTTEGYDLHAIYQHVDGVSAGTNVLLAGIEVGKVTRLEYVKDGHRAKITMRIDDSIELPNDSVALIISAGMLGGKYIKIEPGGEEEVFEAGDYFEYVQDAIIFEQLLEKIVLDAEYRKSKARETTKDEMKGENANADERPFGSLLK